MSGDRATDPGSAALPDGAAAWLDERAAELGLTSGELLGVLVESYRAIETDEADAMPATDADLQALDENVEKRLGDIRRRVVQVKREVDGKAPADHDHAELRERTDAAGRQTEALSEELSAVERTVADVRTDLDAGFENYEEVLEYLTETTDRLETKLDTLARIVAETRTAAQTLARRAEADAAVDELAERANSHGVRTADCEDCDSEVDIALLTEPTCPQCAASFTDVEPKRGLFGSATLTVGDYPALEAGDDHSARVAELLEEGDEDLERVMQSDE